jgi:hypothetical protein
MPLVSAFQEKKKKNILPRYDIHHGIRPVDPFAQPLSRQ